MPGDYFSTYPYNPYGYQTSSMYTPMYTTPMFATTNCFGSTESLWANYAPSSTTSSPASGTTVPADTYVSPAAAATNQGPTEEEKRILANEFIRLTNQDPSLLSTSLIAGAGMGAMDAMGGGYKAYIGTGGSITRATLRKAMETAASQNVGGNLASGNMLSKAVIEKNALIDQLFKATAKLESKNPEVFRTVLKEAEQAIISGNTDAIGTVIRHADKALTCVDKEAYMAVINAEKTAVNAAEAAIAEEKVAQGLAAEAERAATDATKAAEKAVAEAEKAATDAAKAAEKAAAEGATAAEKATATKLAEKASNLEKTAANATKAAKTAKSTAAFYTKEVELATTKVAETTGKLAATTGKVGLLGKLGKFGKFLGRANVIGNLIFAGAEIAGDWDKLKATYNKNDGSFTKQVVHTGLGTAGSIAGFAIGAKVGAAIGTAIFPGLGSIAGAVVGGIVGFIGSHFGKKLGKGIAKKIVGPEPGIEMQKEAIQNNDADLGQACQVLLSVYQQNGVGGNGISQEAYDILAKYGAFGDAQNAPARYGYIDA